MSDNRYRDIEVAANEAAVMLNDFTNARRAKEGANERYDRAAAELDAAEHALRCLIETVHIGEHAEEVNVP